MTTKTKRTYNLSPDAVAHVRDLAARMHPSCSQDGVVELAIERLYRDILDQEEAASWSRAAQDPEFQEEMQVIAATHRDLESWPT